MPIPRHSLQQPSFQRRPQLWEYIFGKHRRGSSNTIRTLIQFKPFTMAQETPILTFACGLYDRVTALYTGEVKPEKINLKCVISHHPRDLFDRQASANGPEFDSSEQSASEYITRLAAGDRTWVAIPVFPSRLFRHGFIVVNANKVKKPSDLNGARIGVQLYTMTAAVWIRQVLQQEGVALDTVEWVEGSLTSGGKHGSPTVLQPLRPVNITTNESGKSLDQLLVEGHLDAVIGAEVPPSLGKVDHIQRLFTNYKEKEKVYYRDSGIFPIMHLVVIRRALYERYPFVAKSLYDALEESKRIALERMFSSGALRYMLPWLPGDLDEIREVFGDDPWPYGVERNRKTLEALVEGLFEQGMTGRRVTVDELFVSIT